MIKPIKISPLNNTDTLEYKCEKCFCFGTIKLSYSMINTDNDGNSIEPLVDYECYKCGEKL